VGRPGGLMGVTKRAWLTWYGDDSEFAERKVDQGLRLVSIGPLSTCHSLRLRAPEMCRAVESKQSMIVKVGARW